MIAITTDAVVKWHPVTIKYPMNITTKTTDRRRCEPLYRCLQRPTKDRWLEPKNQQAES